MATREALARETEEEARKASRAGFSSAALTLTSLTFLGIFTLRATVTLEKG